MPPIIFHAHIPKTAGTAISDRFGHSFRSLHLNHYHHDPLFVLNRARLTTLLELNPCLKSVSSHHLRSFPPAVGGRPALYVTFLREPTRTFISLLRYTQREWMGLSAAVRAHWPEETPNLPLKVLAERFLDRLGDDQTFCPQTRFLCCPESLAPFGLTDGNGYGADRVRLAASVLSRFHVVGIVEQMKESLDLMGARLRAAGLDVWIGPMRRANRANAREDLRWLHAGDPVGKRVLACNASDEFLYQTFCNRLLEEHRALKRNRWRLPEALRHETSGSPATFEAEAAQEFLADDPVQASA